MHTALHGISSHSESDFQQRSTRPCLIWSLVTSTMSSSISLPMFQPHWPPCYSSNHQAHSCLMRYTCYFICPRHSFPQFLDDSLLHLQSHSTFSMPLPCFSFLHSPYYSWHTRCFTSIYFIVRHWSPYHYHYKLLKGKNVCFVPYGYSQQLKHCLNPVSTQYLAEWTQ